MLHQENGPTSKIQMFRKSVYLFMFAQYNKSTFDTEDSLLSQFNLEYGVVLKDRLTYSKIGEMLKYMQDDFNLHISNSSAIHMSDNDKFHKNLFISQLIAAGELLDAKKHLQQMSYNYLIARLIELSDTMKRYGKRMSDSQKLCINDKLDLILEILFDAIYTSEEQAKLKHNN
jgi:hypothetical protein